VAQKVVTMEAKLRAVLAADVAGVPVTALCGELGMKLNGW
jgi:hypothetical protein